MSKFSETLIQITNKGMGQGDDSLGAKLLSNYFTLLLEDDQLPKIIVFYNAGVVVLDENYPAFSVLKSLEDKGVLLLACKTCLIHYNMLDSIKVGKTGTMIDIIALQSKADKVINL